MKTINDKQFKGLVNNRVHACFQTLDERGQQYATEDRLHNFRRAAAIQNCSLCQAVTGMMMKHLVSVLDMAEMRRDFSRQDVDEKFTDLHNYLYFLEQAIVMEKEDAAQKQIAREMLDKAKEKMQRAQEAPDIGDRVRQMTLDETAG